MSLLKGAQLFFLRLKVGCQTGAMPAAIYTINTANSVTAEAGAATGLSVTTSIALACCSPGWREDNKQCVGLVQQLNHDKSCCAHQLSVCIYTSMAWILSRTPGLGTLPVSNIYDTTCCSKVVLEHCTGDQQRVFAL